MAVRQMCVCNSLIIWKIESAVRDLSASIASAIALCYKAAWRPHSYSVGLLYCDYQAFCRERQIEPVPLETWLRIDMLGRSACVSKAGGSGMILQSPQQHSARYRQTHQAEMAARRAAALAALDLS